MASRIIKLCFYILFFLTPLVWTPLNYELFEYNKMIFVYLLTVIITGVWIINCINSKSLILKRTPLDIPLMIFLLANILSTIFSIDPHTSIWGYYSRSNGGLLSLISYLLLYYALVSNLAAKDVSKLLKAALLGGLLVALWAIPEHFGVSLSCVLLTSQINASCWVQDVQARVFATLGQPNWLAAYLAMLIFPSFYLMQTATRKFQKIFYTALLILFYLGFTFTYSRGASLGLLAGLIIFLSGLLLSHADELRRWKLLIMVLISFLAINLFFGSALTGGFRLIKQYAPPRPSLAQGLAAPSSTTQLENGGTESGQIRLIVWKGALEIFKHYPVFGSGVETFAYSYYNFRPKEHNLVSEWDFLYNKAHNEYLNYLATTGLVGFASYMALIITFLVWSVKRILEASSGNQENSYSNLGSPRPELGTKARLLTLAILASYTSYLIQNFFLFSVVIIALFFYLYPAFSFVASGELKPVVLPKKFMFISNLLSKTLYRRRLYQILFTIFLILMILYFVFKLGMIWLADTYFSTGTNYSNAGNPGKAYNQLIDAVALNPGEPFFRNELGYAAAASSTSLESEDASLSATLKNSAIRQTEISLSISPKNVSFWRTAVRTYYQLASVDPSFNQKTLDAFEVAINLAPTDPKLYYNKALILGEMDKKEEAIKTLKQAIELKPNYRDAHFALGVYYQTLGQKDKALEQMHIVLKLIPNDPDAVKKLEELEK